MVFRVFHAVYEFQMSLLIWEGLTYTCYCRHFQATQQRIAKQISAPDLLGILRKFLTSSRNPFALRKSTDLPSETRLLVLIPCGGTLLLVEVL